MRRSTLFDPMMRTFFRVHFDPLGKCTEVVAAVAAKLGAHAPAGGPGKRVESARREMAGPSRSSAPSALSASARAWSRVAFSSTMRSFSKGSVRSATPFSIAA